MHLEPLFGSITPKAQGTDLFPRPAAEAYPQSAQSKALEMLIVQFQEIKCSNLAGPEKRISVLIGHGQTGIIQERLQLLFGCRQKHGIASIRRICAAKRLKLAVLSES